MCLTPDIPENKAQVVKPVEAPKPLGSAYSLGKPPGLKALKAAPPAPSTAPRLGTGQ